MIARWMLAAIAFSTLMAVAAWALEHACRATRRPVRGPWVVALAVAALWPLLAPLVLTARQIPTDMNAPMAVARSSTAIVAIASTSASWLETLDPLLLSVWGIISAALLLQMAIALRTLQRIQQRATAATIDGEAVLIDRELGPAVVGLRHPRIVVPEWLADLDAPLRTLVLTHEREHCSAGDPRLVWVSALATTLVPWNPALWWIARRLRLAMEIDCDTRTLNHHGDTQRYASLLMLIAQRHTSSRFAPLLSPAASQLNRRISSMRASVPRYRVARLIVAAVVSAGATAAACSPRVATNLTSPAPLREPAEQANPQPVAPIAVAEPATDSATDRPASLIRSSRGPSYPEALKASKASAAIEAMFVVNADGRVDTNTVKIVTVEISNGAPDNARALFVGAVRAALNDVRYNPARVGGRNVRQLMSLPFEFAVGNSSIASAPKAKSAPRVAGDASANAAADAATSAERPYFDFQVEVHATARPGSKGPLYPQALRDAKIEGQVLVQFVVDTLGVPDARTFKVLRSDNAGFTDAVRAALPDMRFEPARVGGRAVKQLVQSPFMFSLSR
jgi:TonB family protein